jgi:membrane-associated phospholipid phosphatase
VFPYGESEARDVSGSQAIVEAAGGTSIDSGLYTSVTGFARHTPWLHTPMTLWTDYGLGLFVVLFLLGWWLARRDTASKMAAALWAPAGTVLAYVINSGLKSAIQEQRPCRTLAHAYTLVACPGTTDYSFPSNHATIAAAAAAAIFLVSRWFGLIAAGAALLMAASRVYVGVHYPHDVLVGAAIGAMIVLGFAPLARRLLTPLVERLRTTPLRPLLTTAG